jgi:colanic acid/amylovoran biosynthesis glycosyltransferase
VKIAFIVGMFPALSETFILNQITGLIELGHAVDIFAMARGREKRVHPDVAAYDLLARTVYLDNLTASRRSRLYLAMRGAVRHVAGHPLPLLRSMNMFEFGREALALRTFLLVLPFLGRNYDIVHCHYGPNGTYGAMLKQMGFKAKLVTMFHGWDIRNGLAKGKQIYQRVFRESDCILSISRFNYRNLLKLAADPKKIRYHPVGIDTRRFSSGPANRANQPACPLRLLTVARLAPEKGIEFGIHAVRLLINKINGLDINYRIVGDGPLKAACLQLVRQLHLEQYIDLPGEMTRDEIVREMNVAHLFLLPSVQEALPVVLMEAMAMELPVVATAVGGTDELVGDGVSGFLVEAANPETIAERLRYLVEHPRRWASMGRAGRRHVEQKYEITILNRRLVKIYEELLS